MIRSLAPEEIERVLHAEVVGRIGCAEAGQPYVVPVSYAYAEGAIYGHSGDGQKIRTMRQNPQVCFEVDHVEDLVNWHSVICTAVYEELEGEQARRGLDLLRGVLRDRIPRELAHGRVAAADNVSTASPVIFRLKIQSFSGREERLYWELLPAVADDVPAASLARAADAWLSQSRAAELCDLARVIQIDAIWEAADCLAEGQAAEQVARSLAFRGVEPDMAHRIVGFLTELRDQPAYARA